MNFFTKLSNGWKISMNSFSVLKANKQLIIFPILSGISLLLILSTLIGGVALFSGGDVDNIGLGDEENNIMAYLYLFVIYLINYFVVVFFNMALVHCTRLYFKGEEVTVQTGLQFSLSRIGVIFSWAVFAATVGVILKAIQENSGWLGRIITGIIGIVWNISVFFVVPVIAYENLGPIAAFKRSASLMKQKWGESLGATFSFGLVQFVGILLIAVPLFFLGSLIHFVVGIALAAVAAFTIFAIVSACETIFISSVYHNINGDLDEHFNQQMVDDLFVKK